MRPKVLVLFKNSSDFTEKALVKKILKYGWDKSFLDFSLIKMIKTNLFVAIYDYNPFYNIVNCRKFNRSNKIFPDKLQDMNGYKFNSTVFNYSEDKILILKIPYENMKISLTDQLYLNLTLKIMNFKVIRTYFNVTYRGRFFPNLFENNYLDLISVPFSVQSINFTTLFLPSFEIFRQIVALVPIIPISDVIALKYFSLAITFFGIFICLVITLNTFKCQF